MISASSSSVGQHDRKRDQRRTAYRILLLGMVFGIIATTLIIFGTSTANGTSPVLAVGGWIGIIASITCVIVYVFRLSSAGNRPVSHSLSEDEIATAQALAEAIDRESAGHPHANGDKVD